MNGLRYKIVSSLYYFYVDSYFQKPPPKTYDGKLNLVF